MVKEIKHFRNRIAHHEEILNANASAVHKSVLDLVAMRCATTAGWVKHHSTVNTIIRTKPKKAGAVGPTVLSKSDPAFRIVGGGDSLAAALAGYSRSIPALVRLDVFGAPSGALSADDILAYLTKKASEMGGMIDLNDHSIDDVIKVLQQPGVQVLVATDTTAGAPAVKGVIARAHRRY